MTELRTEQHVECDPEAAMALLTVDDIARLLRCSSRTVYRLTDSGRIPRPVKLGALVRWPKTTIETWIGEGCPRPKGGRR